MGHWGRALLVTGLLGCSAGPPPTPAPAPPPPPASAPAPEVAASTAPASASAPTGPPSGEPPAPHCAMPAATPIPLGGRLVAAFDLGPDRRLYTAVHPANTAQLTVEAFRLDDLAAGPEEVLSAPLRGEPHVMAVGHGGFWLEVASSMAICSDRVMWADRQSQRVGPVTATGCVEGPRSLDGRFDAIWSHRPQVVAEDRFVLAQGPAGASPTKPLGSTYGATIDAVAVVDDAIVFGATDGAVVHRTLGGVATVLMTSLPSWDRVVVAVAAHGDDVHVLHRRRGEALLLDTPPGHPGQERARFDARFDRARLWAGDAGLVVHLRDHDREATEPVQWIDPTGACPPRTLFEDATYVAVRDGVVVAGGVRELSAMVLTAPE